MPETPTVPDDEALVAQLRAWADDLADQVPATPVPTASAPRRRLPPRLLAVAAVVLVALGVAAVVTVGDDPAEEDVRAGPTTTPVPDVPLPGTSWWLERLEADGEDQAVPSDPPLLIEIGPCDAGSDCEGGEAVTGYDGCNTFSGLAEVGPERFVVAERAGTQRGCGGPESRLAEWIDEVTNDEVAYAVDGDLLVLRSGDVVATYRAGDGIYPPLDDGASVLDDPDQQLRHRLSWREVDGVVELRADMSDMNRLDVLTVELGDARGQMAALGRSGRRPTIVMGLVDARATTVTFDRQEGGDPTATTIPLAGRDDVVAFTMTVPGVSGPWDLTATDASGAVVATYEPPS